MCFETNERGASRSPLSPAGIGCVYPVPSPSNPDSIFIVRGTVDGIHALEALLRQRHKDGYELGLATGKDRLEQVEGALRALLERLVV